MLTRTGILSDKMKKMIVRCLKVPMIVFPALQNIRKLSVFLVKSVANDVAN